MIQTAQIFAPVILRTPPSTTDPLGLSTSPITNSSASGPALPARPSTPGGTKPREGKPSFGGVVGGVWAAGALSSGKAGGGGAAAGGAGTGGAGQSADVVSRKRWMFFVQFLESGNEL